MENFPVSQEVLRTDLSGRPLEWINYRDVVRLDYLGQIAYSCGSNIFKVYGGHNAISGNRSVIKVNSIIATFSDTNKIDLRYQDYIPPLNNRTLFKRDQHLCLYCAKQFSYTELTRDHIHPVSAGGSDCWNNVVTACKRCNNFKGCRLPEDAGMQLIAIPFIPTYVEYILLKGRRILADQMEYLLTHIPRKSEIHARIKAKSML